MSVVNTYMAASSIVALLCDLSISLLNAKQKSLSSLRCSGCDSFDLWTQSKSRM